MSTVSNRSTTQTLIMVVDDDEAIVELLSEWLGEDGYKVCSASTGTEALRLLFELRPVLSIVDLRMHGMDGFQLISRIRELVDIPILVFSAMDSDEHIVKGLDLGADDYLVKPVSKGAFLARVRSHLRRVPQQRAVAESYADGIITMDVPTHRVTVADQPVHLRPLEFRLLTYLINHRDRMVAHEELLDQVWDDGGGTLDSLKWYVSSLRRKIEPDPQRPRLIENYRGLGYRYVPPQGQTAGG